MKPEISYSSVFKVLGELLTVEGIILLLPLVVEIAGGEGEWFGFLVSAVIALLAGGAARYKLRNSPVTIHRREGFLLVSLCWVVFSLVGMIPFMACRNPLSLSDAFFETVSGFTTTGATTIADVEALSPGVLLWRSMTQWIGGLGIILFMLAILPQLNVKGGIPMYNAETTGITHDKLHPRIRRTAGVLWLVYIVLTLILFSMLWIGPMDFFDALNHALTAISTGGFSTKNASIAYWHSDYVNITLTIFMFAGGINFGLIYLAAGGRPGLLFKNDVFRLYTAIVVAAYVATVVMIYAGGKWETLSDLLVAPMFHLVSDITTTGFSLADFSQWGPFCFMLTVALMICGACAGSTSGALKVDRVVAMMKNLRNEFKLSIYPKRVMTVKVNGGVLSREEIARVMAFISIYIGLTFLGALAISAYGWNFTDSFFASLSCVGNNGLGYGMTGVEGGFHLLPDPMKWLMSLMMLAGRLELFSVLIVFWPFFWRK